MDFYIVEDVRFGPWARRAVPVYDTGVPGLFVVENQPGVFIVTHAQSGKAVKGWLNYLFYARKFAKGISHLLDWTLPDIKILRIFDLSKQKRKEIEGYFLEIADQDQDKWYWYNRP